MIGKISVLSLAKAVGYGAEIYLPVYFWGEKGFSHLHFLDDNEGFLRVQADVSHFP